MPAGTLSLLPAEAPAPKNDVADVAQRLFSAASRLIWTLFFAAVIAISVAGFCYSGLSAHGSALEYNALTCTVPLTPAFADHST